MASNDVFIVSRGCSLIKKGTVIPAGTEIIPERDGFSSNQIENLMKSGHIEIKQRSTDITADQFTEDMPGLDKTPALPSASVRNPESTIPLTSLPTTAEGATLKTGLTQVQFKAPKQQKPSAAPVKQAVSIWNIDPVKLIGKSLDDLNLMVLERDKSATLFDDIDKARAFLSKDYAA